MTKLIFFIINPEDWAGSRDPYPKGLVIYMNDNQFEKITLHFYSDNLRYAFCICVSLIREINVERFVEVTKRSECSDLT